MVKTPRTRHSRTEKEPVTIDLTPDEVSRVTGGSETGGAAAGKAGPGEAQQARAAAEPRTEAPAKPAEAAIKTEAKPAAGPDKGPAFGRQDPPASAVPPKDRPAAGPIPPERPAQPAAPTRGGGLVAGLVGGVAALALAAGLQFAGLLPGAAPAPSPAVTDHGPAIAELEARIARLGDEIAALSADGASGEALAARLAEAEERVAALAAGLDTLRGEVAGLGAGPDGEAPATVDLAPIEERIAAVEAALAALPDASASESVLAALRQEIERLGGEVASGREGQAAAVARLDALEAAVATLTGRVDEQAEAPATAIIIAASSLKAAIDRGTPFTTELDTYAALAPDAPQLEALRALAAAGVPTRPQIAAESDAAANAMIAAAQPADPDAGLADRLWGSMMGLVQVRPIGMVEGEGVPEIVARLDAAIAAGDYERALAEYEALPPEAKAAGEAFIARVRARHAADRLVDEALAAALRA